MPKFLLPVKLGMLGEGVGGGQEVWGYIRTWKQFSEAKTIYLANSS